jgi:hypothetical protein
MAWVKRNLIFVIIIVVGLIATGYCGYLLSSVLSANAAVSGDYTSTLDQLKTQKDTKPPASDENIQAAKADQERVHEFLGSFRKAFAPFPIAPKADDRQFVEHLQLTLRQFAAEATNAGVSLPPDYAFSFSQERQKISFTSECIGPWMQELEEIRLILRILYTAKINYLEVIRRVPACNDDFSGDDCLNTASLSNQWGLVTPYQVSFRGFSTEVASVLEGFAVATNCFVVKYVDVKPSLAPLPTIIQPTAPQPMQRYMPPQEYPSFGGEEGDGRGRGYGNRGRPRAQPQQTQMPMMPTGPTPPETFLQETPLYITVVVDVVKLKASEDDAVKPKASVGKAVKRKAPEQ